MYLCVHVVSIFHHLKDLDLVPTDIAAGLILLETEQKHQPRKLVLHKLPRPSAPVPTYLGNGVGQGTSGPVPGTSPGSTPDAAGASPVTTNQPKPYSLDDNLQDCGASESHTQPTREETLIDIEGATCSDLTGAAQQNYDSITPAPGEATNSFDCGPGQTEVKQALPDTSLDRGTGADTDKPYPRPAEWMTVPNCAYYMRYALACYSWPIYMYMHPCVGCCKLTNQCR